MLSGWSSARVSSNLHPNPMGFLFHPWECGGTRGPETKLLHTTKFHSPSHESLGDDGAIGVVFSIFILSLRKDSPTRRVRYVSVIFLWAIIFQRPNDAGVVGSSMMQKWIRRSFGWSWCWIQQSGAARANETLGFLERWWGHYPHFQELRSWIIYIHIPTRNYLEKGGMTIWFCQDIFSIYQI